MSLESYYEPFYIQELVKVPSESGELYEYRDGKEITGLFVQKQSGETAIASSQGIATAGRFATGSDVRSGAFLRRKKDGFYIKLVGDPLPSPAQALTQVTTWESRVTSRTEQMKEQQGSK